MKKLFVLASIFFLCLAIALPEDAQAQGAAVNTTAINLKRNSDTLLKVYTPPFFGGSTTVTVGALYTTAGATDTLCTVKVLHALVQSPLNSMYGQLVNDTTVFHHDNLAGTSYHEQTVTIAAGVSYLGIVVDRDTLATAGGKIQVYIKPGSN